MALPSSEQQAGGGANELLGRQNGFCGVPVWPDTKACRIALGNIEGAELPSGADVVVFRPYIFDVRVL